MPITLSPTRWYQHELLKDEPQTEWEHTYQNVLQETCNCVDGYKHALIDMQAHAVLNGMYTSRLCTQLQAGKDKQRKQKKGKLNSDGLPKLLTSESFQTLVNEQAAATTQEKVDRENRQKRKQAQSEVMATWREGDKARKQRNKRREDYQQELHLWEEECELAKQEGRQKGWDKPTCGKLEGVIPKPSINKVGGSTVTDAQGRNGSDGGMQSEGGSEDE
ncbi:hypothetical protein J3R82DRAFT_8145 [Butyriboletus roseoflavus]|nr:hypothetical protein J3R82DRAFT_8145 [Butyriboletus roseoflavus]